MQFVFLGMSLGGEPQSGERRPRVIGGNPDGRAKKEDAKLCVLVTGGGGFVGSHLIRRLVADGHYVISLGGNRATSGVVEGAHYIFGDISRDTLETVELVPDFIYHLGAAIYGEASHTTASHDRECLPISPYGVHKRQVEYLLLDHARMYETKSVILRPFSVYGPGLRKQLLWDAMQKADRESYEFFGTGRELRDWVYISDLVECLIRIRELACRDVPVVNAGTCRATSVRHVITELYCVAGIQHVPIFVGQHKEGDPDRLVADDSAEGALGPLFSMPLREGLGAFIRSIFFRIRALADRRVSIPSIGSLISSSRDFHSSLIRRSWHTETRM